MKKLILLINLFVGIVISLHSQTPPSYIPTNGLVAWYPFNGNANDESGNSNNGTVNGAVLTTDRNNNSNKAYYFSSSGCGTYISANINTSSIVSGLTISIWVSRVGNGCLGPRIFEFGNTNGPGLAQWTWDNANGTNIGSTTSNSTAVTTTFNPVANNVWTNLVYTNDGSFGKVYQDGVLIKTITSSGNPILSGNVSFGRMNHPSYDAFNGKLDDIGIWNRALSNSEVTQIYNAVLPSSISNYNCYFSNNTIVNKWQSVNETNLKLYSVQRSIDGNNFISIGNVDAKGASSYIFTDVQLPDVSSLYYRLEILDKDGKISYSPIVSIMPNRKSSILLSPNPTYDLTSLQVKSSRVKEEIQIIIFNQLGDRLIQQNKSIFNGENSIPLNLEKLQPGVYFLQVSNNFRNEILKFIKN